MLPSLANELVVNAADAAYAGYFPDAFKYKKDTPGIMSF